MNKKFDDFLEKGLVESSVPDHLRDGLIQYLRYGRPPGHFLTAVISNDLTEAINRADEVSERGIGNIVRFLYNFAPSSAWGSPERMNAWIEQQKDTA